MTRTALTILGISLTTTLLVLSVFSLVVNNKHQAVLGSNTDVTSAEIISRINAIRLENNLPTLKLNEQLMAAAVAKATSMQQAGYWSHDDATGQPPWHFLEEAGYQYLFAGENLAKDFYSNEHLLNAWTNSAPHRANLLNPVYTETGVAVLEGPYLDKENTTVIVQYFATPMSLLEQYGPVEPEFSGSFPISSLMTNKTFNSILYLSLLCMSVILFSAAYHFDKKSRRRQAPPIQLWRH